MKRTSWTLPVIAFAILALAVLPANALQVFVGYADNLRPSPFFPIPFFGDPSVALFAGESPLTHLLDSGAVRLFNDGASAVTINTVEVHMKNGTGSDFKIWNAFLPFTLDPGKNAIFVQTAGENFDTSDTDQLLAINGVAGNTFNNCSVGAHSTEAVCVNNPPQVIVNGEILLDTGHVLDTGGFDSVTANPCTVPGDVTGNCNESLQWRLIGTCGINCPGGEQVPEPATAYLLGTSLMGLAWVSRRAKRSGHELDGLAWTSRRGRNGP